MAQVFLVYTFTGESADATERVDGVFSTHEKAEEYAEKLRAKLKKAGLDSRMNVREWQKRIEANPDLGWVDYTGATVEVSIAFTVDAPQE